MTLRLGHRGSAWLAVALLASLAVAVVLVRTGPRPAAAVAVIPLIAALLLRYRFGLLLVGVAIALTVPAWWSYEIPQASVRVAAVLALAPLVVGQWAARLTLADGLLLLFFLDSALGGWLQTNEPPVWRLLFDVFLPVAFYVAARALPTRLHRRVIAVVVGAITVAALTVILERLAGHILFGNGSRYSWVVSNGGIFRPAGVYGSPPAAALAMAIGLLLSVSLRRAATVGQRLVLSAASALMLTALVLTFDRSGMIALALGLVVYLWLVRRDAGSVLKTAVAVGLATVVAVFAYPQFESSSAFQNGVLGVARGNTLAARTHIWQQVLPIVGSNPRTAAFGLGFGSQILASRGGRVPTALQFSPLLVSQSIHNQYFLVLLEQGAVGLTLLLLLFGWVVWHGYRFAARTRDRPAAAMTASILAVLIVSVANTPLIDRSNGMLALLLLGLLTSRASLSSKRSTASGSRTVVRPFQPSMVPVEQSTMAVVGEAQDGDGSISLPPEPDDRVTSLTRRSRGRRGFRSLFERKRPQR